MTRISGSLLFYNGGVFGVHRYYTCNGLLVLPPETAGITNGIGICAYRE